MEITGAVLYDSAGDGEMIVARIDSDGSVVMFPDDEDDEFLVLLW